MVGIVVICIVVVVVVVVVELVVIRVMDEVVRKKNIPVGFNWMVDLMLVLMIVLCYCFVK